jgi:membrane-bound lytic murein transglycosylase D
MAGRNFFRLGASWVVLVASWGSTVGAAEVPAGKSVLTEQGPALQDPSGAGLTRLEAAPASASAVATTSETPVASVGPDTTMFSWEQTWRSWCAESQCISEDVGIWTQSHGESDVPALDAELVQARLAILDAGSPMDFTWNEVVHQRIAHFAANRKKHIALMLGRGAQYFPLFEEALDRHGLPMELKYLSVVESALNPVAKSPAGAGGLWQFMHPTAKIMGLRVDAYVDERQDPIRSTEAACQYLSKLHDLYGDWFMALAAYNCGPGNVNKAIRRSGNKTNYWEIRPFLPSETQGYVPAFVAIAYMMEYHGEHQIAPVDAMAFAAEMDTIMVRKPMSFRDISAATGIEMTLLEAWNPMYRLQYIPAGVEHMPLRLPVEWVPSYLAFESQIPAALSPRVTAAPVASASSATRASASGSTLVYKVKSGDVLGSIAKRHGVTVQQIQKWNGLRGTTIHPGQKLTIHGRGHSS